MPDAIPPVGDPTPAQAPSNNVTPPATPPAVTPEATAEVERLRKELEQKDIRNRQLENEAAARKTTEEEAARKKLEEDQQFKTLADQEKVRADAAEAKLAQADKQAEVKTEADKLLADYSPEVRKLATEVGVSLTDTDDTSVAAFKARLDALNAPFGGKKVTPNNPNTPDPGKPGFGNADGIVEQPLDRDPNKFDELAKSMPGIASMMRPQQ